MVTTKIGSRQIGDGAAGVDLAVDVTGTLPVANGGTGAASLLVNGVLLGNGVGAVQTVAPGPPGSVLRSDGTIWGSAVLDTLQGNVFEIQRLQRDTTVLAGNDVVVLNSIEVPANASLEVPANSSLEILPATSPIGAGGVLPAALGGTGTALGADAPAASSPSSPLAWATRNGGQYGIPGRRTFYMNDPDSGATTTSIYEDTGQPVIYSVNNPQIVSRGGRMTFTPISGSPFDYRWWNDPRTVTRVGGKFTFDPTGGRNTTNAAVTYSIQNDTVANSSLTSFRMALHFVCNPSYWQLDTGTSASGSLVFTNIATGNFATPLVQDGVTQYRMEAWLDIATSTITILLPDGNVYKYTNAAFAANAGPWGFHEVSANNGATDTIPGYTETWSDDSPVQYPPAPTNTTVTPGVGVADLEEFCVLTAPYTLTSTTAAQRIFNIATNGAVTLPVGRYFFDLFFTLSAMSATNGGLNFLFGSTATISGIQYQAIGNKATPIGTGVATALTSVQTSNGVIALTPVNTVTVAWARIQGTFRLSVGGAIFPQLGLGVAAAAIVGADSYFRVWRAGPDTVTSNVGNWS